MSRRGEATLRTVTFDDGEDGVDDRNLISEAPPQTPPTPPKNNSVVIAVAVIFVVLLCIVVGAAGHKVFHDRYYPCPANNTADYERFYNMVHSHFENVSGGASGLSID